MEGLYLTAVADTILSQILEKSKTRVPDKNNSCLLHLCSYIPGRAGLQVTCVIKGGEALLFHGDSNSGPLRERAI